MCATTRLYYEIPHSHAFTVFNRTNFPFNRSIYKLSSHLNINGYRTRIREHISELLIISINYLVQAHNLTKLANNIIKLNNNLRKLWLRAACIYDIRGKLEFNLRVYWSLQEYAYRWVAACVWQQSVYSDRNCATQVCRLSLLLYRGTYIYTAIANFRKACDWISWEYRISRWILKSRTSIHLI